MSGATLVPLSIIAPDPLTRIALALEARLRVIFPEPKFSFQSIPAQASLEEWSRVVQRLPMIGLGFSRVDVTAMTSVQGPSHWTVFLATQNQRGVKERLVGDQFAPGLFAMVAAGAAILHRHTLEDATGVIGSVLVHSISQAYPDGYAKENLAMGVIEITVPVSLALSDMLAGGDTDADIGAADLLRCHIAWGFDTGEVPAADALKALDAHAPFPAPQPNLIDDRGP